MMNSASMGPMMAAMVTNQTALGHTGLSSGQEEFILSKVTNFKPNDFKILLPRGTYCWSRRCGSR
jgi:hypothetical protein